MTGQFTRSIQTRTCVFGGCKNKIQAGDPVYLWHGLENHSVCPSCAKARWGYEPNQSTAPSPESGRESIGFDSTKSILKSLQQRVNEHDPKLRAAGDQ